MKIEAVAKLKPVDRFLYWIRERHQIYLKRKAGKPWPWTDDEILMKYKFCNVLRINDRTSAWLLNNWYAPNLGSPDMLLACVLARQLNCMDSLSAIGFPSPWKPDIALSILEKRTVMGLKNYSPAYMITSRYGFGKNGRARQSKVWQTVRIVCQGLLDANINIVPSSMQKTWEALRVCPGMGPFMAGQVVADLRWAVRGSWDDKLDWAPMGLGSIRGLNRWMGMPPGKVYSMNQKEFLSNLLSVRDKTWGLPGIPSMEAMDLQGCLCEFDKYERVLQGQGRPKVMYRVQ